MACGHNCDLHPRTTGHPRNSLCLEHALSLARNYTYCHVVPGFILMEKPGAWQGNNFFFLTHMRLGQLCNWKYGQSTLGKDRVWPLLFFLCQCQTAAVKVIIANCNSLLEVSGISVCFKHSVSWGAISSKQNWCGCSDKKDVKGWALWVSEYSSYNFVGWKMPGDWKHLQRAEEESPPGNGAVGCCIGRGMASRHLCWWCWEVTRGKYQRRTRYQKQRQKKPWEENLQKRSIIEYLQNNDNTLVILMLR